MLEQDVVRARIEREYHRRGDQLGWRLLSSPWETVSGAKVAFVGLQPGGGFAPSDHPDLCTPHGSAYVTESWGGAAPGQAPLQRQVRALFDMLGVAPEAVLAGNLVPFRSPNAKSYPNMGTAVAFGEALWADLLIAAQPRLVITMAGDATRSLARIGGIKQLYAHSCNWGNVRLFHGESAHFRLVGLPHLSRFRIGTRETSRGALQEVLKTACPLLQLPRM